MQSTVDASSLVTFSQGIELPNGSARRQAELENTNVSTAFQRVISEPQHHPISVESTIRVLSNLRQLSNSLTTLTVHLDNVHRPFDLPELTNLAQQIESVLLDSADAVEQQRLPQSFNVQSINNLQKQAITIIMLFYLLL